MRLATLILVALLALPMPVAAEIYKWTDESGQVHYSQQPPPEGAQGGDGTESVEVVDGDSDGAAERPARVRRQFCTDVTRLAHDAARAMRNGARFSRVMRLSRRSAGQALARAVVSRVWAYRATDHGPAAIASAVRGECLDGTYAQYLERHWREQYPDRPMPRASDDGARQRQVSAGTAWAIGPRTLVTSHHVVADSPRVEIVFGEDDRVPARIIDTNRKHDLARLRLEGTGRPLPPLPINTKPASLGASVLTIGFPHVNVMGRSPKVTTGVISSLAGPRDDRRLYQISAPIQSGNSGGPLLDQQGRVIGVIAAKLNAEAIYRSSGDLPENVNYAVKSTLLEDWVVRDGTDADDGELDTETLVSRVRDSVFIVLAH